MYVCHDVAATLSHVNTFRHDELGPLRQPFVIFMVITVTVNIWLGGPSSATGSYRSFVSLAKNPMRFKFLRISMNDEW